MPLVSLLPEIQRNKDAIRCAALGAEVPGHCPKQPTKTLFVIVCVCKKHLFLIVKSQKNIFELVTRLGHLFRPLGQLVELVL